MKKGNLSREQAIAAVGVEAVEKVEAENCDFTSRIMPPGWGDVVEFSACTKCVDHDGDDCVLVAYYYQDQSAVDEADKLDHLDWEIAGYEIY